MFSSYGMTVRTVYRDLTTIYFIAKANLIKWTQGWQRDTKLFIKNVLNALMWLKKSFAFVHLKKKFYTKKYIVRCCSMRRGCWRQNAIVHNGQKHSCVCQFAVEIIRAFKFAFWHLHQEICQVPYKTREYGTMTF